MTKEYLMKILVILVACGCCFFAGWKGCSIYNSKDIVHDTIYSQIEKIYIQNDSLLRINDSINIKVIEVEKTYEKTIDAIKHNNLDDDYLYFTNYVARYCSSYQSDSVENNEFDIR